MQGDYFQVGPSGISPFQCMLAYLGGSAIQTIVDNPLTSYRQLVQAYSKSTENVIVDPKTARDEARAVFMRSPVSTCVSGLTPRLVGVGFKRVPKFGFFLGYSYIVGENTPSLAAATMASIMSAPFINPIRMIEKQQRVSLRTTGLQTPVMDIIRESAKQNFIPLFRGTVPLMGHSLASATLGLVGQPKLQKHIQKQLGDNGVGQTVANLGASAFVAPIYVTLTNPLSRLEVIMQTQRIDKKPIILRNALTELSSDLREFGMRGVFRGQGLGICKAIVSLTVFHEGRIWLSNVFVWQNSPG